MAKTALDLARGQSTFVADPETDLVLVTDKKHPLYDERVHLPLNEAFVLAMMKFGWPGGVVEVAKEGEKNLVVDGRQRVKHAIEANKRLKAQGAEPISVPCLPVRGDAGDKCGVMISMNEFRTEDSIIGKAKKAAQLARYRPLAEVGLRMGGASEQTVSDWLALLDLAEPVQQAISEGKLSATKALTWRGLPLKEQEARLAALLNGVPAKRKRRPAIKSQRRVVAAPGMPDVVKAYAQWVLGEISTADACRRIKGLKEALAAKEGRK